MKKPADAIEKEFNDGGVFFLEAQSIVDNSFPGNYVGVSIEIAVMTQEEVTAPDFSVSVINRREVAILFTDWAVFERDGQKILSLSAFQRLPDGIAIPVFPGATTGNYMSFLDLCFFAGNEAIPEVYGEDVVTRPAAGAKAQDLGWTLPSRFVDALIDALGKLDHTMLGGNMQQALLYGPVYSIKS